MPASASRSVFPRIPISPSPDLDLHCVVFHLTTRELRRLDRVLARFPAARRGRSLMRALRAR